MVFYLGTHMPSWLAFSPFPLFISHRRLNRIRRLPVAMSPWCLDSGGFSELSLYGEWRTPPVEYAAAAQRYLGIGQLQWAAPQDWMCEPFIIAKTGKSVEEHQWLSVNSLMELGSLAPEVPWVPVIQGYTLADYERCISFYISSGIDLWSYPAVGVGSVCRRQATEEIVEVFSHLHQWGLRLHGFGVKMGGLRRLAPFLASADSLSWSFSGRRDPPLPGHEQTHRNCANCFEYASRYRERLLCSLS